MGPHAHCQLNPTKSTADAPETANDHLADSGPSGDGTRQPADGSRACQSHRGWSATSGQVLRPGTARLRGQLPRPRPTDRRPVAPAPAHRDRRGLVTDRWIHLDGCANARDLGDLPTTAGGSTRRGLLIRCDTV
ncbi:tyrosine-protein phosphatase, partial [Frankia sp. Cas4]|uniref:tyrosine-protein phosphatase n=1 Tax=Frankia sp. Cas4 TaxID=3073927 RepID=UPI002AD2209F